MEPDDGNITGGVDNENNAKNNIWLRRYTRETKVLILNDILRFSKLHAWYRYLPLEGKEYLIFPWKGQQPKNPIFEDVTDRENLHWWIWDASFIDEMPLNGFGKEIVMKYKITLNCFFRGVEIHDMDGSEYERGWSIIANKYPRVADIMRRRYPIIENKTLYFKLEHKKQVNETLAAIKKILSLLQERCPIWLTGAHSLYSRMGSSSAYKPERLIYIRGKRHSKILSASYPQIPARATSEASSFDSGSSTQTDFATLDALNKFMEAEKINSAHKIDDIGKKSPTLTRLRNRLGALSPSNDLTTKIMRRTQSDFSLINSRKERQGADAYEYNNNIFKMRKKQNTDPPRPVSVETVKISSKSNESSPDGNSHSRNNSSDINTPAQFDAEASTIDNNIDSRSDNSAEISTSSGADSVSSTKKSKHVRHKFHLPSFTSWRHPRRQISTEPRSRKDRKRADDSSD